MIHNALLKKQPANWGKAPDGANFFYRFKNGIEFFTDKVVTDSFIHESVLNKEGFKIVYHEEKPTIFTSIHTRLNGEIMAFTFPGELKHDDAVTELRKNGIWKQGMSVMCVYFDGVDHA